MYSNIKLEPTVYMLLCIYNYIQCTVHTIGLHVDAFAGQVPVHNGRLFPILVAELGMEE